MTTKGIFCFITAAAFAFVGCTEDELYDKASLSNNDLHTLYASTFDSGRSRLNIDDFSLTWAEGDRFTVYDSDGIGQSEYLLDIGSIGSKKGKFNVMEGGTSKHPAVALFPKMKASLVDSKLSVTLPDEYDAELSKNVPMVGVLSDNQVNFQHCLAVIRFNLNNLPDGFNTIRIESSNVINGAFKVADISRTKTLVKDNTTGKKVTIHNFRNGELFYLPVPAITITKMDVIALKGSEELLLHTITKQSFKSGFMYTLTKDGLQIHNSCELLMDKIRESNRKNIKPSTVQNHLNTFNASTGAFTDIDYNDHSQTNWQPLAHVERLSDWAFAYTTEGNYYYGDEDLYNKLVKGLDYWNSISTFSTNWWYKDLKEPQILGLMLVQMRSGKKQIPDGTENAIITAMHKTEKADPANNTGANCTDISLHWIYRGCLTEDQAVLDHAFESAYKTTNHTTGEGIQADNSFFQHGNQIYFGGYGDEFIKAITQIAIYGSVVSNPLQGQQLENLSNFMRKGFYLCLRDGYMPFGVLGRGVSRPNGIRKTGTAKYAERMMEIDPAHREEFKLIAERLGSSPADYAVQPSHTHFHRADYTLHVRPEYTFDVRMASKVTARCEVGNGENLKGYYIADGSTNILVSGKEYFNIFPTWNWACVPGTTAPQGGKLPMNDISKGWGTPGMSYVVGGVSDGLYGVSAMNYMDNDQLVKTGTHKSWYFFDDEVVCLGVVNSTSGDPVKTTVNQCLSNNMNATVKTGSSQSAIAQGMSASYIDPEWIFHNHVGYIFPQGGKVWANNVQQSGSWYDINTTKNKDVIRQNVFSLGFDYATPVKNAPYAYIVLPAVSSPSEVASYVAKDAIQIVHNSYYVQSVYHKTLKIWGISFLHTTNQTVTLNGITVTANRHCTVMMKEKADGQYEVWVANIARASSNSTPLSLTFKTATTERTINTGLTGQGAMGGVSKMFDLTL